jgi:hypothetical protein
MKYRIKFLSPNDWGLDSNPSPAIIVTSGANLPTALSKSLGKKKRIFNFGSVEWHVKLIKVADFKGRHVQSTHQSYLQTPAVSSSTDTRGLLISVAHGSSGRHSSLFPLLILGYKFLHG